MDRRDTSDVTTTMLLTRIERLERQNRRLKCLVLAVAASLSTVMGAMALTSRVQAQGQVVVARSFLVVDERGRVRAEWGWRRESPHDLGLYLYAADGTQRAGLSISQDYSTWDYSTLTLGRQELGQHQAFLGVFAGRTFLSLNAPDAAVYSAVDGDLPSVSISRTRVSRARLGVNESGHASLVFYDSDRNPRLGVGLYDADSPHIGFSDDQRRYRAGMWLERNGEPQMGMWNANEQQVFVAP
ncbi:MAG: hypothetical protein HY691_00675 [Chloroflexi bacterium]|nr:hypothetical protein [Chloroflexota bacterium]